MQQLLSFESVSFNYHAVDTLLRDVTFGVARGEMAGLLGPNGAGKTTLIRLASGALQPSAGVVRFDGRDLREMSRKAAARSIAVVPQDLTIPFAYTVRQMIEMGRSPHLPPLSWGLLQAQDRRQIAYAIEMTATGDLADRIFNELSGGERQRVLVAMALAQSPELLLLDEPTAHLDVKHQIDVLELVARLNRETGLTVLASLHDLNLAARYFPRLILFQRGIVADGPPSAVLTPELLEQVYQVRVQVGILRGARHLSIIPPGDAENQREDAVVVPRAHVVAGGGTGDLVMRALVEAAIPFTAGALNIGDSDATLAQHLAVDVIAEPPFAPIGEAARMATTAAMVRAGVVVVCPIPIGPGNVALLDAARAAQALGAHVWLFEPALPINSASPENESDTITPHVAARDYTGGAGVTLYRQLCDEGARVVTSLPALMEELRQFIKPSLRNVDLN